MELKTIQKPVDVFLLPDGTYLPVAGGIRSNPCWQAWREKPASDTPLPEGNRKWYDRGNEAQEELWRHCT